MCTTCVQEFSGAFIIALDIQKIYTRVRARVISQNVFYFFRWLGKKDVSFWEICFIFSLRSSTYSLTVLSETDNARKESQSQRRIYHIYIKVVQFFLFFLPPEAIYARIKWIHLSKEIFVSFSPTEGGNLLLKNALSYLSAVFWTTIGLNKSSGFIFFP